MIGSTALRVALVMVLGLPSFAGAQAENTLGTLGAGACSSSWFVVHGS